MPKTLLAMGAHYDDCVFGVPGIMLKAVRKHWKVVIVALIGDYRNWPPIKDREKELVAGSIRLAEEHGVEMRFLDLKSHQFDDDLATRKKVAEVVADVAPDVALYLWDHDHHDDHVTASKLCRSALRYASPILDRRPVKAVGKMYAYDNGPRHTIGFVPNVFVDVSDEWPTAIDWLGKLMALVRNEAYNPLGRDSSQQTKEAIALYRGKTCGVKYAEALHASLHAPTDILL